MILEKSSLEVLRELHQGEVAVIEAYQEALARTPWGPWTFWLRRIHDQHREAASILRRHIRLHGGVPSPGSDTWGAWAQAIAGMARRFGRRTVLTALKTGEQHSIGRYQAALEETLPRECLGFLREHLLPRAYQHLAILDEIGAREEALGPLPEKS